MISSAVISSRSPSSARTAARSASPRCSSCERRHGHLPTRARSHTLLVPRMARMLTDLLFIPMGARFADMREAAIEAEDVGFDGIWTWDHLRDPGGASGGVPESWTALTAIAALTRRITVGPLVL